MDKHRESLSFGRLETKGQVLAGLQADELCTLQNQHEAEMASLAKCRQLVSRSRYALSHKQQAGSLPQMSSPELRKASLGFQTLSGDIVVQSADRFKSLVQ